MKTACLAAFLVVLAWPATAEEAEEVQWTTVIHRNPDLAFMPGQNASLAVDGRTELRNVSVADLGDYIGLRLTTQGGGATFSQSIASTVLFEVMGWDGAKSVKVAARDTTFLVTTGAFGDDEPNKTVDPERVKVLPGSNAWAYEVHLWRGAFNPEGHYRHGDEVSYFTAEVNGTLGRSGATQNEWGTSIRLEAGGGYAPDEFAAHSDLPWYTYNIRADFGDAAMAVGDDGAIHAVYRLADRARGYYEREQSTLGIYHVRVTDGRLAETYVAPSGAGYDDPVYSVQTSPLALHLAPEAHVFFHPKPSLREAVAAEALVHASQGPDGWRTEKPLAGLGLGKVAVDEGSALEVAGIPGRIVVAVRLAEGAGMAIVQDRGSGWSLLRTMPDADAVRLGFASDGVLHAAILYDEVYTRVTHAEETAWLEEHVAERVWSVDMAMSNDVPCFIYQRFLESSKVGFHFLCLDGEAEVLEFFEPGSLPSSFALASDRTAAISLHGWFGQRLQDGTWWWEVSDHGTGSQAGMLPDGRAVTLHDAWGGFGGIDIDIQHPDGRSNPTRAFYFGPASESYEAMAPYRPAAEEGAAQVQSGQEKGPDGYTHTPKERPAADAKRNAAGAALSSLLVCLAVAVFIRVSRRAR